MKRFRNVHERFMEILRSIAKEQSPIVTGRDGCSVYKLETGLNHNYYGKLNQNLYLNRSKSYSQN